MNLRTRSLLSAFLGSMLVFASPANSNDISNSVFEGDIIADYDTISGVYDKETVKALEAQGVIHKDEASFQGSSPEFELWNDELKNELYVIRAYIDPEYDSDQYIAIKRALKKIAKKTGVFQFYFPPNPPDGKDFLHFKGITSGMCASYVGKKKNLARFGQPIYLDAACISVGIIQHETMHALGFWHEQARPDRDSYVSVNMGNVLSGKEVNFAKQNSINSLGAPYDYDSVMHYPSTAFSKNGQSTIEAPLTHYIGQRNGISAGDKLQMRLLYQCKNKRVRTYPEFQAEKCNSNDCKCGEGWRGCTASDQCKTGLTCQSGRCMRPSQPAWDYGA
jgi:hypothetical protein